jgi:hypothetical protein
MEIQEAHVCICDLRVETANFNIRKYLFASFACMLHFESVNYDAKPQATRQTGILFNIPMRISSQFKSYLESASNVMPDVSVSELRLSRKTAM